MHEEEKKLEAEIKKAAKMGNKEACAVLAKQLVNLRKQKTRSHAAGAKMSAVSCMHYRSYGDLINRDCHL